MTIQIERAFPALSQECNFAKPGSGRTEWFYERLKLNLDTLELHVVGCAKTKS